MSASSELSSATYLTVVELLVGSWGTGGSSRLQLYGLGPSTCTERRTGSVSSTGTVSTRVSSPKLVNSAAVREAVALSCALPAMCAALLYHCMYSLIEL
jgi:hypothetical protein